VKRNQVVLVATLAASLMAGTCDRYFPLVRTVSLTSTPESSCVVQALRKAELGSVNHSCRNSPDTGELTDYFRIAGEASDEWVTLSIPRAPGTPSEARFSWGRLNKMPSVDQTARIRRIMGDAYAAIHATCPGLPDPATVKESCGWCD
jgi:hypothetical protein